MTFKTENPTHAEVIAAYSATSAAITDVLADAQRLVGRHVVRTDALNGAVCKVADVSIGVSRTGEVSLVIVAPVATERSDDWYAAFRERRLSSSRLIEINMSNHAPLVFGVDCELLDVDDV